MQIVFACFLRLCANEGTGNTQYRATYALNHFSNYNSFGLYNPAYFYSKMQSRVQQQRIPEVVVSELSALRESKVMTQETYEVLTNLIHECTDRTPQFSLPEFTYSGNRKSGNHDVVAKNKILSHSPNTYRLHLTVERSPFEIDPRKTLASYLVSDEFAQSIFYYTMKHVVTSKVCLLLFLVGDVCFMLSLLFDPYLGWFTLVGMPSVIAFVLTWNFDMIHALIRTFEWWAMLSLLICFIGSAMDAVRFDPPRMLSLSMGGLAYLCVLCLDARPFGKRRDWSLAVYWVVSTCIGWTLLIMWWCGQWLDARQTIIPVVDTITVDVQSIGFSAYLTLNIVLSKYTWMMFVSKESNQCLILKVPVAYRYHRRDGGVLLKEKELVQFQSLEPPESPAFA
jgi:hypothetical protein